MIKVTYIPPRNQLDRVLRVIQRNMRGGSIGDVVVLNPGEAADITLDNADGVQITAVESQVLRTGAAGPRGVEQQLFGNNSEMDVLLTPPQGTGLSAESRKLISDNDDAVEELE